MHGCVTTLVLCAILSAATDDPANRSGPLATARALRAEHRAREAVETLESALLEADTSERAAVLDELRAAYEQAASEADAAGESTKAASYRENLKILNRKRPVSKPAAPPPESPPAPIVEPTAPPPMPAGGVIETDPAVVPASAPPPPTESKPPRKPTASVDDGDDAFRAERYDEAARIYAEVDRAGALPETRRVAWAYCRMRGVVARINAPPTDADEWLSIQREIDQIQRLSPRNWYGEYLRNLAAERSKSARRGLPGKLLVRGASPEEPRRAQPVEKPAPGSKATANRGDERAALKRGWEQHETASFIIWHADEALARRVGEIAEDTRIEQTKRWSELEPGRPWSPKCEIYLYPNPEEYARQTQQTPDSPGFSTAGLSQGKVVVRTIHLRANYPKLQTASLPHEVTHIVLADLFPNDPLPRWADEGIAALAEPDAEQQLRLADLAKPLAEGRLISLEKLTADAEFPPGNYAVHYAQSLSLLRFLVERDSPKAVLALLREQRKTGIEPALRRHFRVENLRALQALWERDARDQLAARAGPVNSALGAESAGKPSPGDTRVR